MAGGFGWFYLSSMEYFTNDTWHNGPNMPYAHYGACAVHVEPLTFVIGGFMYNGGYSNYFNTILAFNFDGMTWTEKTPMKFGRYGHACAYLSGKIYVTGRYILCFSNDVFANITSGFYLQVVYYVGRSKKCYVRHIFYAKGMIPEKSSNSCRS